MIHLVDAYYVNADSNQYILQKEMQGLRKNPDTGAQEPTTYYKDMGYYATMENCVQGCIRNALREKVSDGAITTMRGWLDAMNGMKKEIMDALKGE